MKSLIEKTSDKLVNAFLKNKIIAPIPSKFCKKINEAQKLLTEQLKKSIPSVPDVTGDVLPTGPALPKF